MSGIDEKCDCSEESWGKGFLSHELLYAVKLSIQENLLPGASLADKLTAAERLGFDGVEFWGHDINGRLPEIKQALSTVRVEASTICSGYGGDLLGASWEERSRAVEDIKAGLEAAAELGAVGVVVVPTFGGPKLPDLRPLYPSVWELERKMLIAELRELGEHAENVGAYVLLEPLNRYESHFLNRLEQAVEIIVSVGSPGVALMADLFHMNIEEPDMAEALQKALEYIKHVHLADSNRWLPGFGHTDFRPLFRILREGAYAYYMALECYVPEPKEANLIRTVRMLRKLMAEA